MDLLPVIVSRVALVASACSKKQKRRVHSSPNPEVKRRGRKRRRRATFPYSDAGKRGRVDIRESRVKCLKIASRERRNEEDREKKYELLLVRAKSSMPRACKSRVCGRVCTCAYV